MSWVSEAMSNGAPVDERRPATLRPALLLALAALYAGIALVAIGPALRGDFVSDDSLVIAANPYVQELSARNLVEILDPSGPAVLFSLNYAPVHLALHAVERAGFGDEMLGYHLVNVALHAGVAVLLVLLLVSARVPPALAVAAAAVFVAHPANAEAVAIVFQAKTLLSTGLAFGAVLAFWRHPVAALALFTLAVLTKITAAFALPMVAVTAWTRAVDPGRRPPHWGWLLAWLAVLVLVAVPELAVFRRIGQHAVALGDGPADRVRTIIAFAARYLVMALSGIGVSVSHSPSAVRSWADPWFLGGLAALSLIGWRTVGTLVRRREEAAWWLAAAAAFVPASQILPFQYPMADRYLYTILPGLMGGVLLAGTVTAGWPRSWLAGLAARSTGAARQGPALVPAAALVALALVFAASTRARSAVFASDRAMMQEAARNYPEGLDAWLLRFEEVAHAGDVAATRRALRTLHKRGYDAHEALTPILAEGLRDDPEILALVRAMASARIPRYEALEEPHQVELHLLARAYLATGQPDEALAASERALGIGGPFDDEVRATQREARLALYREARSAGERRRDHD